MRGFCQGSDSSKSIRKRELDTSRSVLFRVGKGEGKGEWERVSDWV